MGNKIPKVTPEQFNLFMDGKITQEQLLGEAPKKPKFAKADPADRKKAKREEDNIQSAAIAYLHEHYPGIPVYGNATANIFNSGGLYRKGLPKSAYPVLMGMGVQAKTWGALLDHALKKMGLKLSVASLEKEQEGAKFWQMKRTKALGAVSSWPDLQVCAARQVYAMDDNGLSNMRGFHGLFVELKKPDAVAGLPWGVGSNGRFTTNDHTQDQARTLSSLTAQGYLAVFAVGYEEFLGVIENYMDVAGKSWYLQEQPLTFKDGSKGMIYRLRKK